MEIKECHRVLELEIGSSRAAVEAAYLRLLERWHPDRVTPANDPAAIAAAARMIQAANEAYQTLIKIAPDNATQMAEPNSARKKPILPPLTASFTPGEKPPPPPKPTSAPPPPPPHPTVPPPFAAPPARQPSPANNSAVPTPPPAVVSSAAAPASSVPPSPTTTSAAQPSAKRPPASSLWAETKGMHDAVFPVGTARRRFSPLIIAGALFLLILLGRWALPSSHHKNPRDIPPDPTKTGTILVKSNRPDTEVELSGGPAAQPASATFHGSGADSTLRGLLPGKYVLTAKSSGWSDIQQDVNVEIGRSTSVVFHFKSGSLHLESVPERVLVRWGETSLGHTPLVIPALPVGECQLTLEYPTWPSFNFTTTITENRQTEATARLPHGRLIVESVPAGATVLMRNRAVGQTPLTLELVPVGIRKLTLQAKGFPPQEMSFKMEDRGEIKLSRELGSGFPQLDAPGLLRAVWVPDNPNQLAPGVDSLGVYEPRNGIVKNINRKRLYENWLKRSYRYSGIVKSYDRESGKVEFVEQTDALSRYRIVAELSPAVRTNLELVGQLTKGAALTLYGHLDAVEEPRWPFKVISFELSLAEVLH